MASETTEAGHGAAEMAHGGGHYEGMPQLNFEWFPNQMFWLVVTLVVIYLILVKVALPRIANVLSDRAKAISSDLEQAELLKQKAAAAEDAYNKALADARAEAGRIVAETKAEIQKDLDVAIEKADAEIAAKAAESEAAIAEIRAGAVEAIEVVAKDTAEAIIASVLPAVGDEKSIAAAVKTRMKGVEG